MPLACGQPTTQSLVDVFLDTWTATRSDSLNGENRNRVIVRSAVLPATQHTTPDLAAVWWQQIICAALFKAGHTTGIKKQTVGVLMKKALRERHKDLPNSGWTSKSHGPHTKYTCAAPPPSPHAARSPYALPAYGASGASPFAAPPFAAPPGGCGAASSPSCLLDSLTVEEFVSLRSSREREFSSREFSSRELVDLTCEPTPWTGASEPNPWTGANSLDSTLLEDAGRLNLSSFTGLAGLLDAL